MRVPVLSNYAAESAGAAPVVCRPPAPPLHTTPPHHTWERTPDTRSTTTPTIAFTLTYRVLFHCVLLLLFRDEKL